MSRSMALSSSVKLAVVVAALAATAATAAAGCSQPTTKVTVQNLCGKNLQLAEYPMGNSASLFVEGTVLRHGARRTSAVCWWYGTVSSPGAPTARIQVGNAGGGAWYTAPNVQSGPSCRISVTARGNPVRGSCPAAGCVGHGRCYGRGVAAGACSNVQELRIVFSPPY